MVIAIIVIKQLQANEVGFAKLENKNKIEEGIEEVDNKRNDIFGAYYGKANEKLQTLTLEEKIAQLFIIGTSTNSNIEDLEKYQFGGYLLFKDFFEGKTDKQVQNGIEHLQKKSQIPLFIAVDEEGGKVVRVSSNPKLVKAPFQSPSELYQNGGLEAIKKDTIQKSNILSNLGINLNFAPVIDIATNPKDYMYQRSIQQPKEITALYAKTVIRASKDTKVSYTLKHFPGYGNNEDTHTKTAIDERTYEELLHNDLEPFRAGIEEKAEAVIISHNTVTSIDKNAPASISKKVHELLRNDLSFTGVIITDAINMGAIQDKYTTQDAIIEAILAGNDMIIISVDNTTKDKLTKQKIDYETIINAVKTGLNNGKITQDMINKAVIRILSWKYEKGLM